MTTFYMKHGDVEGEATVASRRGWIPIGQFTIALENGAALMGEAAQHQNRRRRSYSPYIVRRRADSSTPLLMQLAATNALTDQVKIHGFDSNQNIQSGNAAPVLDLSFTGVSIRSIKVDFIAGELVEEMTCAFRTVEISHKSGARFRDDLGD